MTKKEEFEKQGFEVIEGREIIDEEQNHLLEFLKNNYPSIYKDGEINIEEFKRVLDGKSAIGYKENGYGLNFIGRNLAKAKYRQKTEKELSINEKLSKNFDETENIIIKGDNLDSLKILKKYYSSKIKCIYIDPPYNTNSDNFLYPDRFDKEELEALGLQDIGKEEYDRMEFIFKKSKKSHNGWLTFMYPRLKLARDLLTDDGAIFISIDDNEQANLKLLCDEIFGEDNFVANFIWKNRNSLQYEERITTIQTEYIMLYIKNKDTYKKNEKRFNKITKPYDGLGYKNPDNDPNGAWITSGKERNDGRKIYTVISPTGVKHTGAWIPTKEEFEKWDKEGLIWWGKDGSAKPRKKSYLKDFDGNVSSNILFDEYILTDKFKKEKIWDIGTTESASKELNNILSKQIFNYPKPSTLIKYILYISSAKNDIVLDFFAGSGTTAHAVMELNAEDGGNRKFILCQIDEEIKKEKSAAYDFCIDNNFEPVISSITVERVNRAGDKILKTLKESNDMFDDKKIDIGYKVFDLHDVNIEKEDENKQIILLLNGVTDLSRIYNMIINIGLNSPVSKLTPIIENCAYMIEEDNIKRYYITNSEILIKNDENKQKFKDMIESGMVYIDGWTVTINVSLQQYKDNVKIVL